MVCRIAFKALSLAAGLKFTKYLPHLFFDLLGRNLYPKKSNFSLCIRRPVLYVRVSPGEIHS